MSRRVRAGVARAAELAMALGVAGGFAIAATLLAVPAGAQTGDGSGDSGGQGPAEPTAGLLLPVLDQLTGDSIAAGIGNPDSAYSPPDSVVALGADGQGGNAQVSTRLADGELNSDVVVNVGETRAVVTVKASICPAPDGTVSYPITLSIVGATKHEVSATAKGSVSADAKLVGPKVDVGSAKGHEATLLHNFGLQLLKNGEAAWRGGYCVKVDVSEGQSRAVKPKEEVPISATARSRFGGGEIKGRMESKKIAGQKKVGPASVSASPAKFTYTGPDKRPQTGSVKLTSVSRRGIGTANLEYTTEYDLKVDGVVGTEAHVTGMKCGGPVGAWDLTYTSAAFQGEGHLTFELAKDILSGPVSASGTAAGGRPSANSGTVTYTGAPDGKSGTLVFSPGGSVTVTGGEFCGK